MHVPRRHVLKQLPVIATLARTAVAAARPRPSDPPEVPGPALTQTVAPRSADLVRDYVRHVGGNPAAYRETIPAHLFPQWGFPLQARTLEAVPYDLTKVLNGGCRMEQRAPIPAGEPLELRARLESIDDDGRRAVIETSLVTGTRSVPEALTCRLYAIVPLSRDKRGKPKERPRVDPDHREIDQWRLGPKSGLEFAVLTGDFNPVHWVRPYARAAGFRSTILHGFSTLARSIESMNRNVRSGDVSGWGTIDVRFTRPLMLPAKPRVFHAPGQFAVGDALGGPAFLIGTYESSSVTRSTP